MVNYDDTFQALLSELKLEGRYRTFAERERIAGAFPAALRLRPDGSKQRVTVWCGNARQVICGRIISQST
ncbi:MAG: hypothetical protein ABGX47_24195 [Martelella sp.]|uniref:hypothetical protein n=1 Tax=Martelella sp. TaxID=1969699 RepID=UPI0032425AE8